ncbi:FYVE-type domain-containing protein [Plasmodiophora brassicae]|uniref:FYVE-type domain-containing protein n=1 Tax=Plasmodiophora brassicae TaxID=37360 RepID=A0A3P3YLB5_PLABS|nr:unnamed protein product [Plasmodiophora brassicae]
MQEHPQKLILGWMGHLVAPVWVDKKAYNACYHCNVKFSYSHQHHCRLCGHMYCSMCTAKYMVNSQFKRKDKEGPDRVCFGCRDQCMERRAKFVKNEPPLHPQMVTYTDKAGVMHIYPPVWVKAGSYANCKLCYGALTSGNTHHCRVCGDMFDNECTIKMEVPPMFKKKMKKGPARVCIECRYQIMGGAILDEGPAPPLLTAPSAKPAGAALSAQADPLMVIGVRWEDSDVPLASVNVVPETTLDELNARLLKTVPALRSAEFTYVCRGRPIFREHWSVFNAEFLRNEIVIRPGTLEVVEDPVVDTADDAKAALDPVPNRQQQHQHQHQQHHQQQQRQQKPVQRPHAEEVASDEDEPAKPARPKRTDDLKVKRESSLTSEVVKRVDHTRQSSSGTRSNVSDAATSPTTRTGSTTGNARRYPSVDVSGPALSKDISSTKVESPSDRKDGPQGGHEQVVHCRCKFDFKTDKPNCLPCAADELLVILKRPQNSGWWLAENAQKVKGWVPAKFMAILDEVPADIHK